MYQPKIAFACVILTTLVFVGCQPQAVDQRLGENATTTGVIVDAACGQCQFGLAGDGCDLAVRIGEQAYYVDGTAIDDHGDAHAKDGFCTCVRQAKVTGKVTGGRFVASSFELLPLATDSHATGK